MGLLNNAVPSFLQCWYGQTFNWHLNISVFVVLWQVEFADVLIWPWMMPAAVKSKFLLSGFSTSLNLCLLFLFGCFHLFQFLHHFFQESDVRTCMLQSVQLGGSSRLFTQGWDNVLELWKGLLFICSLNASYFVSLHFDSVVCLFVLRFLQFYFI